MVPPVAPVDPNRLRVIDLFGVEFRLFLNACVEEVLLLERILVCEDY